MDRFLNFYSRNAVNISAIIVVIFIAMLFVEEPLYLLIGMTGVAIGNLGLIYIAWQKGKGKQKAKNDGSTS